MAGRGSPDIGVAHGMDETAEAARGLAEDAAPASAAAGKARFDLGQHFADQEVIIVPEDG